MLKTGNKKAEIARYIGRSKSTISNEIFKRYNYSDKTKQTHTGVSSRYCQ